MAFHAHFPKSQAPFHKDESIILKWAVYSWVPGIHHGSRGKSPKLQKNQSCWWTLKSCALHFFILAIRICLHFSTEKTSNSLFSSLPAATNINHMAHFRRRKYNGDSSCILASFHLPKEDPKCNLPSPFTFACGCTKQSFDWEDKPKNSYQYAEKSIRDVTEELEHTWISHFKS